MTIQIPERLNRPRLKRTDASEYLAIVHGLSIAGPTLAKFACRGGGPRFQKAGRQPLYPREELDAWAEQRLGNVRCSSSDAGEAA